MISAVVSTRCPTCGAPIEFGDDTRAVRCAHCRSQLLVTGRRQVLSYVLPAAIADAEARAVVRFSLPASRAGTRVASRGLHLVPYYRLTAEELTWGPADPDAERRRNVREVAAWLGVAHRPGGEADEPGDDRMRVSSRVLERNFLACETGVVPPSLGVRPAALRLELFDREGLPADCVVVATELTPRQARERALADEVTGAAHTERLRVVLQIVYFPFWMVSVGSGEGERVAVVDGLSGTLLRDDARPEDVRALAATPARPSRTVGLRPLVCPNCGWDLPLRPGDVVFHCSSCENAWLARGERLDRVAFAVGAPGDSSPRYLPVWRLFGRGTAPVFAPAFRCRRLRAVVDIGAGLTRRGTAIQRTDRFPKDLVGCSLDEEDARALSRFVVAVLGEKAAGLATPEPAEAELLWLPFSSDGYALVEPLTGAAVPHRLLDA